MESRRVRNGDGPHSRGMYETKNDTGRYTRTCSGGALKKRANVVNNPRHVIREPTTRPTRARPKRRAADRTVGHHWPIVGDARLSLLLLRFGVGRGGKGIYNFYRRR